MAFSTLTQAAAAGGASARQHLLARRCPLCRVEIVGQAFPVLPLKGVASLLVYVALSHFLLQTYLMNDLLMMVRENELIEVSEGTIQKSLVGKQLAFEKETPEAKHMAALQMGCWAQVLPATKHQPPTTTTCRRVSPFPPLNIISVALLLVDRL